MRMLEQSHNLAPLPAPAQAQSWQSTQGSGIIHLLHTVFA